MNSKPRGGKRWAFGRVLASLITGMGFPAMVAFFALHEHQLAYASLAVTVGALGVLGTGYIAGESYRPHDYGDIVIQQGGPNVHQRADIPPSHDEHHIHTSPFKERG